MENNYMENEKLNKWNREENKVNCEMKKTGNRNQVEV